MKHKTLDAQMSDARRETMNASHVSRLTSPRVSCLASRAPWPKQKLDTVCESISDGDHQAPPQVDSGVPFITISNFDQQNSIDFSNTKFVPEEYYNALDPKRKARSGDVLYSVVGSFGIPVLVKNDHPFAFQRHIAILRPNDSILPEFLFYSMKTPAFFHQADGAAVGAAQRTIGLSSLRGFTLSLPPLSEQRRIVGILSAYDDLIENNRKRIVLLEESARQLYKEWFVRLRFPGHERVPVEDGVPKGWKRATVGEVCSSIRDAANPKRIQEGTPYIGLEHMPRRSITLSEWSTADDVTSGKLRFREGEILFGKIRPYFHKVGIALVDGVASSDAIVIRPNAEELLPFVLLAVSSDAFVAATAQGMREGSKMPRADWKQMQEYPLPLPPPSTLEAFNALVTPVLLQCRVLALQSRTLAAARDALLPKLITDTTKEK